MMASYVGQKMEQKASYFGHKMEQKYLLEKIETDSRYMGKSCLGVEDGDQDPQGDLKIKAGVENSGPSPIDGNKAPRKWPSALILLVLLGLVVSLHILVTKKANIKNPPHEMISNIESLESKLSASVETLRASIGERNQFGENSAAFLKSELDDTKTLLASETQENSLLSGTIKDLRASAEESRIRYEDLLASREELIRRLQSDLNECKSEKEKAPSVSKAIDALRGQIEETNTKSDDIVGLMNSQLEEVKRVNRGAYNKAFLNLDELQNAVDMYLSGNIEKMKSVMQLYGAISTWDVSQVTSFQFLFDADHRNHKAADFNEDLSAWDVSNGSDFYCMFRKASKFNSDLSAWKMSSATRTRAMFQQATSFDSDLSRWDVSNVSDMGWMFYEAVSFKSDIRSWDVAKVRDVKGMFGPSLAERFRGQISNWDLSKMKESETMFLHYDV